MIPSLCAVKLGEVQFGLRLAEHGDLLGLMAMRVVVRLLRASEIVTGLGMVREQSGHTLPRSLAKDVILRFVFRLDLDEVVVAVGLLFLVL